MTRITSMGGTAARRDSCEESKTGRHRTAPLLSWPPGRCSGRVATKPYPPPEPSSIHRAAERGGQRHGGDRSRRCQPGGVRQRRPARPGDSSASPMRSFWTASEPRSFARVINTPWTKRASTRSSRLRRLPQSGHPSYAKIDKSHRSNTQRNKNRINRGHNSPTPQTTPICPPLNHRPFVSTISHRKLKSSKITPRPCRRTGCWQA
jgi:hypothetical protein